MPENYRPIENWVKIHVKEYGTLVGSGIEIGDYIRYVAWMAVNIMNMTENLEETFGFPIDAPLVLNMTVKSNTAWNASWVFGDHVIRPG